MRDLLEPPKELMVREPVDPNSKERRLLKQSIASFQKELQGVVVFLGCSPKKLKDPLHPPEGSTGPFVVSGNNRYFIFSFFICF